jgi:hypothetical protein
MKYEYAVSVTITGTFELDDDEAEEYDEDDLHDLAVDWAFDMPDRKEVDDVTVTEQARV